jgi:DDE superfamily endonuclease
VDKRSKIVICTNFANGKKHDFKLFKDSKVRWTKHSHSVTDTGYLGIQKIHGNSILPKKSSKKRPLTRDDKKQNKAISSERVVNENVIGSLKRFKILSDRYRNRRKRFGLRFNLIAGIYNYEIQV